MGKITACYSEAMRKNYLWLFLVLFLIPLAWSTPTVSFQEKLDQSDHQLLPCPTSPNCVSSLGTDPKHRVEPFLLAETAEDSWTKIIGIVSAIPRSKIVKQETGYLHIEVRSLIFRFVDHLELIANLESNHVDVRSASVLGYSDLGVNRKRVEMLRAQFKDAGLLE